MITLIMKVCIVYLLELFQKESTKTVVSWKIVHKVMTFKNLIFIEIIFK